MLTYQRAADLLLYEPNSGRLTWRRQRNHRTPAGMEAGHVNATLGYCQISIDGKRYYGHRVAWLLMTHSWPDHEIDHINGDRSDNRWSNLRAATKTQNMANARLNVRNTTGLKGVTRDRRNGRFHACGAVDGKKVHLGSFLTPEDAHAAYLRFAGQRYGAFVKPA